MNRRLQKAWKISIIGLALASAFFFPFWMQALCIGALVFTVRPAVLGLVPALLTDLLYSSATSGWKHFSVTGIAVLALIIVWVLRTKTRIFYAYDSLEEKS